MVELVPLTAGTDPVELVSFPTGRVELVSFPTGRVELVPLTGLV